MPEHAALLDLIGILGLWSLFGALALAFSRVGKRSRK